MNKRVFIVLTVLLPFLAMGCVPFKANVTRFDKLPVGGPAGQFYILAYEEQKTSLEFATYARAVSRRLEPLGFREVMDFDAADYVVVFDYSISGGRSVANTVPIYGQTGGGTAYHSGSVSTSGGGYGTYSGTSFTPPTYGMVGSSTFNSTVYDRYFSLRMYDLNQSTKDNVVSVYEGMVTSSGSSGTFAEVSRCIMDVLFDDFHKAGTSNVRKDFTGGKCHISVEPDFGAVDVWRRVNVSQSPPRADGVLIGQYTGTFRWENGKRYQSVDIYFNELEGVRGDVETYRGKGLWQTSYSAVAVRIRAEFNRVTNEIRIWESDPDILVSDVKNFIYTVDGSYSGQSLRDLAVIEATWSNPPSEGKGFLSLQRR